MLMFYHKDMRQKRLMPYFQKKDKAYREKAPLEATPVSSYSKKEYMEFFKDFFRLAHANTAGTSRMAFLNADWRDFESTSALKEEPDNSITIFDYHRLLFETGWKVTHRIECPLSSERMNGTQVNRMQKKRIEAMAQAVKIIELKLRHAGLLDAETQGRIVIVDRSDEYDPEGKQQSDRVPFHANFETQGSA